LDPGKVHNMNGAGDVAPARTRAQLEAAAATAGSADAGVVAGSGRPVPPGSTTDDLERALIARCRAGDQSAFDELVERYHRPLYRLAYRFLGNPEDAADVVQDALVRAYRNVNRFRAEGKVRNWLYTIVVNRALSYRRRRRPTVSLDDDTQAWHLEATGNGSDPAAVAANRNRLMALRQALVALPRRQRAAVMLFGFQGLSLRETAEVMQCAEGTVKSSLHRARARLQRALEAFDRNVIP